MKPGRTLSLLTGVAILGGIARFNEMTPDAQAALIDSAAETAKTTAQSMMSGAVATYNGLTNNAAPAAAPAQPVRVAAARQAGGDGRETESAPPRRVATRTAEADPPPSGNPLWALPLKQLSATRERPVFSPSRRPPPPPRPAYVAPVAIRQPVKPPEPERPQVSLLGTIIGSGANDGIGVFLENGTQTVVRLRIGEDHHGWVLRLVKAREATLVKDHEEAVILALPPPGEAAAPGLGGPMGMPGVAANMPIPGAPAPARGRRR